MSAIPNISSRPFLSSAGVTVYMYGGKLLKHLGAAAKLGAPCFSKLVQNLRLGPPIARSTFVPLCSNRLGPPEPSDRHFGQFGPIWDVFGGPWAKFGGTQLLQIGSKSSTWTSHSPFQLCSTLFQPFDKFCVGEVERGPGHLES